MHNGAWLDALAKFQSLLVSVGSPAVYSRESAAIVRCLLNTGQAQKALDRAFAILEAEPDPALSPLSQYARVLMARALRQTDRLPQAVQLLAHWVQTFPENPQFRRMLGDFVARLHGNWEGAARLLLPLHAYPSLKRELSWFDIKKKLYNGGASAQVITEQIDTFAQTYMAVTGPRQGIFSDYAQPEHRPVLSGRRRVGLISPFWCSSPVYFLCIGALIHLAQDCDLVFFSRRTQPDWATTQFEQLAVEWHDVTGLNPIALATVLKKNGLDVLLDMGGWADKLAMQALAFRPAPVQLKWVGGQMSTTGLRGVFDGFISDLHQSPLSLSGLYTEPLIHMPCGYVTYTPPAYMPLLKDPAAGRTDSFSKAGIISSPMKVSRPFLQYLAAQISHHRAQCGDPIVLQFIGWRFIDGQTQKRINQGLGIGRDCESGNVRVEYIATRGHRDYLQAIARLDWVIDTFPYTSGLTALEAMALGVPLRTHAGSHFSARHAYSHARFCGHADEDILLEKLGPLTRARLTNTGQTLLPAHCPRADHQRLAQDLARLLHQAWGT